MILPRRWLRIITRSIFFLAVILTCVFITDVYLDFLPSSIQSKLPLHSDKPVIVDIDVHSCLFGGGCPQDNPKAGWHRLPKDLYLGSSWVRRAYVYVKKAPEASLDPGANVALDLALTGIRGALPQRVVDDIVAGNNRIDVSNSEKMFEMAANIGWQQRKKEYGLWVKYGKNVPGRAITAVKVLYGSDAAYPLPSWTLVNGSIASLDTSEGKAPRLAFQTGNPVPQHVVPKASGTSFKIAQIADLHMTTGADAKCDQPLHSAQDDCWADSETTKLVEHVLDVEKPNMVVFTGDQIYGAESADPETALLKALGPVIKRSIPYALVFGNHDDNGPLDNAALMEIAQMLPYSLAMPGNVSGVGNYVVRISGPQSSTLNLYFLDSHSKLRTKHHGQYDWIHEDQQQWLLEVAPKDTDERKGKMEVSMAFFHIPLPEYLPSASPRFGTARETVMGPSYNSGTLDVLRTLGVGVVSVGHDHCNDYCQYEWGDDREADPVWLCYGGGTGFGGYGGYPNKENKVYARRVRIFDVDMTTGTVSSWHRVEGDYTIANSIRLMEAGRPILAEESR